MNYSLCKMAFMFLNPTYKVKMLVSFMFENKKHVWQGFFGSLRRFYWPIFDLTQKICNIFGAEFT
ncbi:MAG: hypothetical protein US49_C0002G0107 [candidate division TM6 bacterium GW2011_GWF2_37_49]|nr:MAG: hypothetical protein US49_C0002G0107 [candidate division TM6 bacterium GW2011_GWF2_37_49]